MTDKADIRDNPSKGHQAFSADAGATPSAKYLDGLAQTIRMVDGSHSLGAGALADAILQSGWLVQRDRAIRATALTEAYEYWFANRDAIGGWLWARSGKDTVVAESISMSALVRALQEGLYEVLGDDVSVEETDMVVAAVLRWLDTLNAPTPEEVEAS